MALAKKSLVLVLLMFSTFGYSAVNVNVVNVVEVDRSGSSPIVKIMKNEKELYRHTFNGPWHVYYAELSKTSNLLAVWHCQKPPRILSIINITTGESLADFSPGFGGSLMWSGGLLLHAWGCGTNCQNIAVYGTDGKTRHSRNVTACIVTPDGFYIRFSSLPEFVDPDRNVYLYDLNAGKETVIHDAKDGTFDDVSYANGVIVISMTDGRKVSIQGKTQLKDNTSEVESPKINASTP